METKCQMYQMPSNKVSLEEALGTAERMMALIESHKTRSGRRIVKEVSVVTMTPSVRSQNADTLLFIVNYADEQGFAVLGADKRVEPIYAISDEGHFEVNDDSNFGVKLALFNMRNDAKNKVMGLVDTEDVSLFADEPDTVTKVLDQIRPMLSVRQNRIGSDNCSKYTVNDAGEPALTCCVPIAGEMIMSYYKWPETPYGIRLDWDAINAGEDEDGLARIIAILSDKYHFHVENNTASYIGSCNTSKTPDVFYNTGYVKPHGFMYFKNKFSQAMDELKGGPLFMRAEPSSWSTFKSGHAWVIDGMVLYQYPGRQIKDDEWVPCIRKNTLVHCIWGDNGSCNGYYDKFLLNGAPLYYDSIDSGESEAAEYRSYSGATVQFIGGFAINPFYLQNNEETI